jgi:O-antigen/teichoic acid export membrane protein
MYARVLSSLERNQVLLWGNLISLALKVIFNLLLIPILGVAGIAVATSMVIFVSCAFLWAMARREIMSRAAAL